MNNLDILRIQNGELGLGKKIGQQGSLDSLIPVTIRAGTNTPSDEYESYRECRAANTNMYSRIHAFLRGY